jgi:TRAP-type mannitol/chloroaromatic compound transport system permease small subunit
MRALLGVSWLIDHVTAFIGKAVSWLIVVAVLVSSINAVVRKVLNESSNGWLELQWYLFGATFFLASAWTLARREHIRIDIVSGLLPVRWRQWIELVGHILFLMPLCLLTLYLAWPFFGSSVVGTAAWGGLHGFEAQARAVAASIAGGLADQVARLPMMWDNLAAGRPIGAGLVEQPGRAFGWDYSNSAGGLPIWPAKAMIVGGFILLTLQGVSEILKQLGVLSGAITPAEDHGGHHGAELHDG